MAYRNALAILAPLLALLLLTGCGAPPLYAPRYHGPTPEYYQVRRGDTLYSIGQRFGIDHQKIMLWNDIRDPGRLQLGARLRLRPPEGGSGGQGDARADSRPAADGSDARKGAALPPAGVGPETWRWPLSGRVAKPFGGDGRDRNNGIDIAAAAGTEVRAAAPGKVVYSGNGLRGYGNLIIIRHAGGYITTYAYNQVNLVAEDDEVAAGDVVARVGQTGAATEASLHFEVRHRTEPVDPMQVLPDR